MFARCLYSIFSLNYQTSYVTVMLATSSDSCKRAVVESRALLCTDSEDTGLPPSGETLQLTTALLPRPFCEGSPQHVQVDIATAQDDAHLLAFAPHRVVAELRGLLGAFTQNSRRISAAATKMCGVENTSVVTHLVRQDCREAHGAGGLHHNLLDAPSRH